MLNIHCKSCDGYLHIQEKEDRVQTWVREFIVEDGMLVMLSDGWEKDGDDESLGSVMGDDYSANKLIVMCDNRKCDDYAEEYNAREYFPKETYEALMKKVDETA